LKEPNCDESFNTKVIGLLRYENFSDLIKDFDMEILADCSVTKEELLNELQKFYSNEKQKEYGVLGIRIEK